ncbi:hypothetical protein CIK06_16965 [Plantactinospora sp. KBS50]|nr:hypothetical protein CIK06_16965 [Plantactinospora sp. KBS50]
MVHIAGEADLLLDSQPQSPRVTEEVRAERVAQRRAVLADVLSDGGGAEVARRMLTKNEWHDDAPGTCPPSPLFGVLDELTGHDATRDVSVLVLGTRQDPAHPLDTEPIARVLVDVLGHLAAGNATCPVERATVVLLAKGLDEKGVVAAVTDHLEPAPRYRQALLTWGSGATGIAMGVLTALSRAGLRWQLVPTSKPGRYPIIDPLDDLDADPVAGVLVRWRLFAALEAAATADPPTVRLGDAARDLVGRAAQRHRDGLAVRDCASLRAVVADAVVRRDGTASMAVRRYVTSRYEELLDIDRADHPGAEDLLRRAERTLCDEEGRAYVTLGPMLGWVARMRDEDPAVRASIGLPSHTWLCSPEVQALRKIGNGSHCLKPPAPGESGTIGAYLRRYDVDGTGWREAGLPEPAVTPADTVLAVWPAGTGDRPEGRRDRTGPPGEPAAGTDRRHSETVGEQLMAGLPGVVTAHLDEAPNIRIRAVVFGTEGSYPNAELDVQAVRSGLARTEGRPRGGRRRSGGRIRGEAWAEPVQGKVPDLAAVERAIEARITPGTGALLLVPTGGKPIVLALLRAMRRIGARHGIPLFVREMAIPKTAGAYSDVHLWPALTGGDLPLLHAARASLHNLELDVAWRLLAASAIGSGVADETRRLADAFASRQPLTDGDQGTGWGRGMIAERLELVDDALGHVTSPEARIRLLVLAADAMEASVKAGWRGDTGSSASCWKPRRGPMISTSPGRRGCCCC